MSIDWVTMTAQLVNLLILVVVLRKVLYRPIADAMQRREAGIAERLEAAEARMADAEDEAAAWRAKRKALEASRDELEESAREDAAALQERLERDARLEVAAVRERWLDELHDQQVALAESYRERIAEQFVRALREALAQLAGRALESSLFERMLEKLESLELDGAAPDDLVHVHSAFELDADQRQRLRAALERRFGREIEVRTDVDPDLLAGVELRSGGHVWSWSLRDYVASLQDTLVRPLEPARARVADVETLTETPRAGEADVDAPTQASPTTPTGEADVSNGTAQEAAR